MDQHKIMLFLLMFFTMANHGSAYDYNKDRRFYNLNVDCGATNGTSSDITVQEWQNDEQFINSGENSLLPINQTPFPMNTLRFFPQGKDNCYELPFYEPHNEFLFKAGFYYGNYDGLSKPPSFRIEIDGNFWANVTTSMSQDPVYHELIYVAKENHVKVCLIRTKDDEVPFISSLQAREVYELRYTLTPTNNTALYLNSRINYGANKSVEQSIGPYDDRIGRTWTSQEIPEYLSIHSDYISSGHYFEYNEPPRAVMTFAIQAKNVTDSIHLSFNFSPQTSSTAFFMLYFMDPIFRQFANQTSIVDILIDNKSMGVVLVPSARYIPGADTIQVVTLFPVQVGGVANVTIAPARGTTLPPILNAIEVYSVMNVSKAGDDFSSFLGVFFTISFYFLVSVQ